MTSIVGAEERVEPRAGVLAAGLVSAALFGCALLPKQLGESASVLGLLSLVAPLPLMIQRVRFGLMGSLGASAVAVASVGLVLGPGQGVAFAATLVLPGLLLVEAVARGRGLMRGCGWAFSVLALELGVALVFAGPEMAAGVLEPLKRYQSPEFLEKLRSDGMTTERVEEWVSQFQTLSDALAVVYPAAFLILAALVVLANASLLRAWLARRDPGWLDGGELEQIRWPFGLVLAFVLSGLAVLWPLAQPVAYNVLLLSAFFFALQGLAVVAFYAHRLAGPPLLRAGLLLLVLLNPWAFQILALLGLFDAWFDFRRWAEPPAAEDN